MAGNVDSEPHNEPAGYPLEVSLLGPPDVTWLGTPVVVPRRQTRALLYVLSACPRSISREQLCTLFWAEQPDSVAHRNLTRLLTHLRRSLPDPAILVTTADSVWLDPWQVWADVRVFERLDAQRGQPQRLLSSQQAVALYRGAFLAGFALPGNGDLDSWVTQRRQFYERIYLEALQGLIDARAAQGDWAGARALAGRYLEVDGLAEDVRCCLSELRAPGGHQPLPSRRRDGPMPVAVREAAHQPGACATCQQVVLSTWTPLSAASQSGRPAYAGAPPFVGRRAEFAFLRQAYERASRDEACFVLVRGEPGIGKTRLLSEFVAGLPATQAVLSGASYPGSQGIPYQPILQALHRRLEPAAARPPISPVWLAEASRLLPELRARYPELPYPLPFDHEQARSRLFEALYRLAEGITEGRHPLVLCFDDLHWADPSTLDWLGYLADRTAGKRVLVVATCSAALDGARHGRSMGSQTTGVEPRGARHQVEGIATGAEALVHLACLRETLRRLGVLDELRLDGLSAAAILQILHGTARAWPADEALARRLQLATGGNPAFLLQILSTPLEPARGSGCDVQELPISDALREMVESRLAGLSAAARQVLEAAALLGEMFGFDLVRLVAGCRADDAVESLDELAAEQLVEEQDARYRFRHDVIRRVVREGLSCARRQLLERRAAAALGSLPEAQHLA